MIGNVVDLLLPTPEGVASENSAECVTSSVIQTWVHVSALPTASCIILGQLLHFRGLPFAHL